MSQVQKKGTNFQQKEDFIQIRQNLQNLPCSLKIILPQKLIDEIIPSSSTPSSSP